MDYMMLGNARYERVQYYRQPHDREINIPGPEADVRSTDRNYRGNSSGTARDRGVDSIPEVFNLCNSHVTALNAAWVDLHCEVNYELPREQALKVFDPHWFANNNRPTPGYDKSRVCGGALLTGETDSTNLYLMTLRTSQPVPTASYVLSRPYLWYYGMAVSANGNVSYLTLGDGKGNRIPIKVMLVTEEQVFVPLRWLHKVPTGQLPDAFYMS